MKTKPLHPTKLTPDFIKPRTGSLLCSAEARALSILGLGHTALRGLRLEYYRSLNNYPHHFGGSLCIMINVDVEYTPKPYSKIINLVIKAPRATIKDLGLKKG